MKGILNRNAHFTCAMTLINPNGETEYQCEGICEGTIIESAKGTNGFGYDPIFLLNGSSKTMAELSDEEKKNLGFNSSNALK